MPSSAASLPGPDDVDAAGELALGHVATIGAADDVGAALDRRGDEMHVVRIELAADHAKLLGEALEQLLVGAPGELVDDFADRLVVKPGLGRQRAADRRR